MKLPDILPMRPFFRPVIWGGRRLESLYGKPLPTGEAIGESWEVSVRPQQQSLVAAGALEGWSLERLIAAEGGQLLGAEVWARYGTNFPLLIKFLDTNQTFSIQVHPDDDYVRTHGLQGYGKTEAWYVVYSQGGQVGLGLKSGIDRQALAAAAAAGRIEEMVQFYPVEPGQVVYLPAGTVHTLGAGAVVYEVQQSSELTFRLYDYNRLDDQGRARELHLEESLAAIHFGERPTPPTHWSQLAGPNAEEIELVSSPHFLLRLQRAAGGPSQHAAEAGVVALTIVGGTGRIEADGLAYDAVPGATFLIPAQRPFALESIGAATLEYLLATIP
ncbi:MAG: class I mannose-6-phosphate isomerase [Candidatus Latescibacteria bacterium]|nr:class I mannose-6-phosphate isomerase [Candidatus Latescibacterota bacterium]